MTVPPSSQAIPPEQRAAHAAADAYSLLHNVLLSVDSDQQYRQALLHVLDAAQVSERAGIALMQLPLLTCLMVVDDVAPAVPVAAAWRALHIAAKLLDDVEDNDVTPSEADPTGPARLINVATGLMALANLALARLPLTTWRELQPAFMRTVLQMAGGQHTDLRREPLLDPQSYLRLIEAKSGSFFAWGAQAGARCGVDDVPAADHFAQFGSCAGVVLQLIDDLVGLRRSLGTSDVAKGQRTLAVYYALTVASPPEHARLNALLVQAPADPAAEHEARHLVTVLGGEAYLLAELARYRQQASTLLEAIPGQLAARSALQGWLAQLQTLAS